MIQPVVPAHSIIPCIAADVGGTNARFAVVRRSANGRILVEHHRKFRCDDFEHLYDAIRAYLKDLPSPRPDMLCLAAAGPVDDQAVRLTNRNWAFSSAEIGQECGIGTVILINDIAAQAYGLYDIEDDAITTVKEGSARPDAPRVVVGLGTGLGVTSVVSTSHGITVIPGEAGHARAAASEAEEWGLMEVVSSESPYLSWEQLLSGPGLVRLTNAIGKRQGGDAQYASPEEVVSKAIERHDPICEKALQRFCAMLGGFCGDLALVLGASGGVFLTGSLMVAIKDFLRASDFAARFQDKGPMRAFVERTPVAIITDHNAPLIGAALAGAQLRAGHAVEKVSTGKA